MTKPLPPSFDGFQPAQVDFDAARQGLLTPFRKIDIDVGVAPTVDTTQYTHEGEFIYQDLHPTLSNGNVSIEFNRQQDADNGPIWMVPGLAIPGLFKGFKLSWAVQAGKKVRLIYSTGSRILPAAASISSIGSIVAGVKILDSVGASLLAIGSSGLFTSGNHSLLPIVEGGYGYGSSFASTSLIAAGATTTVFAAGSNTLGAIVWETNLFTGGVAAVVLALIAKASAPATPVDGDVIHYATAGAGVNAGSFGIVMPRSVRIAAGKGAFLFASSLESIAMKSALFTLF